MSNSNADQWRPLAKAPHEVFGPGLFLRFVTPDAPGPIVVLGLSLPGTPALSFFDVQGGSPGLGAGYGQPTLPVESTQDGNRHTVRRDWLLENFDHIAAEVDVRRVGYALHLVPLSPRYLDRAGYPHKDLVME